GTKVEYEEPFLHSAVFTFGESIEHQYFNFTVYPGNQPLFDSQYKEQVLEFEMHHIPDVASRYQELLEVQQVDIQASILNLSSKGEVVQKEVDFQSSLLENYIDAKLSERDAIASSKETFIKEQLISISDSLARAERSLQLFRQSANAVDLTHTASRTLDQIQDLQSTQAQSELNIKYYNSLLQYLSDSNGVDKIIAPSVVGIDDPLLNETLLELKRLRGEQTRMQYLKGAKSYDMEILRQQIDNATKSLRENISNLVASSTLALNSLNGRIATLERTINQLPRSEKELVNFQRRSSLYENLYNYLSQELAKTGIARAEDVPDTRVIDAARMVGDGPVAPQKKLILALGFLTGIFLPLCYVSFIPARDDSFDSVEELETMTDIPLLASIVRDTSKTDLMTVENPNWQAKESFRDLSANIQFLVNAKQKNVIGVTSTIPGEGKTFCAAHLALNMASAGHRVLLIDTDFRNPSLSRQLGKKKGLGFSNYLRGWITNPREVIQTHSKYRSLDYITTSRATRNPHNLLSSPKFEYLIIELRDEYDFILFDCPAVGLVSDYLIISKYIDVHLFVMRHRVSKYSFLSEIEKLKAKGKIENLFIVFNDVPPQRFKYGYFSYDEEEAQKTAKKALRKVSA
ncbi:MAG: polysaccharide biosynthesis tyrosine autokinase, partial [Saprospiraceae bacterium]|nr:polysaccharide biosynthesis tyrosine autokinase [Saprospiraceae bacterium]